MKRFVLYNPKSGDRAGKSVAKRLEEFLQGCELIYVDMTEIVNYDTFFSQISESDEIYICGGDGTLNRYINQTIGIDYKNKVYYYAAGSGNDLANDLGIEPYSKPIKIDEYIASLPIVTVKGETYRFINGVGLGVDGYVCAEKSRIREENNKKEGYIMVALKALFKDYKPTKATVTVDGVTAAYDRVWMASVMKGRFFGGGMKIAPTQNRFDEEGLVTSLVAHNLSKLKILCLFLLIFKGNHIKYVKHVALKKCKEVKVEFDKPAVIQIDGETISDVLGYTVSVPVTAKTQ